jgi:hypothetical protein
MRRASFPIHHLAEEWRPNRNWNALRRGEGRAECQAGEGGRLWNLRVHCDPEAGTDQRAFTLDDVRFPDKIANRESLTIVFYPFRYFAGQSIFSPTWPDSSSSPRS